MSREMENLSMYSLMSTRISASRSAKRNSASVRASSVFPTPVGPEKMNDPMGRLGVLEPGPAAPDRPRDRRDRVVLPDHALVQLVLHVDEPLRLRLPNPRQGDPRPAAHDEGHVLDGNLGPETAPFLLPGGPFVANRALDLTLFVTQLGSALEVLVPDRAFLAVGHRGELFLEALHLGRRHLARNSGPRPGLVDHVDRLVGKEPVRDVPVRQLGSLGQGLVRDRDLVVILVVTPQSGQDLEGLLDRRGIDHHRLEPALQRAVLLDILAILVQRGSSDALQLAPSQRRLEHVGGVDRAFRGAGANQRV